MSDTAFVLIVLLIGFMGGYYARWLKESDQAYAPSLRPGLQKAMDLLEDSVARDLYKGEDLLFLASWRQRLQRAMKATE